MELDGIFPPDLLMGLEPVEFRVLTRSSAARQSERRPVVSKQKREARERALARQALARQLAELEEAEQHAERVQALLDLGPPSGMFITWDRQYEDDGKTYTYAAVRVDREAGLPGDKDAGTHPFYYVTEANGSGRKGLNYGELVEKHLAHATEGSIRKLNRGKKHEHNDV